MSRLLLQRLGLLQSGGGPGGDFTDSILLAGDQQSGADLLLLSGDQQSGVDVINHRFDPDFASVTLLVEPDGPDQATAFTDLSTTGHTLVRNGTPVHDAVIKNYGVASADFDGTGDYLDCGTSTEHDFGSGDFTVECFVRQTAEPTGFEAYIAKWDTTSNQRQWTLQYDFSTDRIVFFVSTTGADFPSGAFQLDSDGVTLTDYFSGNKFYHLAVCRDGANMRVFVNGLLGFNVWSTGGATLFANTSTDTLIGGRRSGGTGVQFEANAHIAGVRITKGVPRYTAAFTPPAFQFNRS